MKHFFVSLTFLLFIYGNSLSQESFSSSDSIVDKIETHLLYKQLDSVSYLISSHETTLYLQSLIRIYRKNNPTYLDYYKFISNLSNKPEIDFRDVSNYINTNVKRPTNKEDINLDYVNIIWLQVSKLRDEALIGEASAEQEKLEDYIGQFNQNDVNVIKAHLLSSTHQLVLYQIQKDVENGKALCLKNLKKADELGDKRLEIIFLDHLCDFYILEGKLNEYIQASEQSLELENKLPTKTTYNIGTIIHLLDAYIYKGGYEKRVEELLDLLYKNPETKADSYSLYAKYIGTLDTDSPKLQSILKQFEVSNLLEFCKKIETLGEKVLNPNDFFHVLNESSKALAKHRFFSESLEYKDKCIQLTRKIYSQDLSNSLASYKTKEAIKNKDIQIKHAKEYSKLYIIIASLALGLLLVTFVFLMRKRQQSALLESKNLQINRALKEKELLVKEVHHRVKNNFQIIESLLELQSKDIKDEKALTFANESKIRLKSMALIHQKLYQTEDGLINVEEYLRLLINEISSLYASSKKVETNIFVNNLFFDIDTILPLGLILNELITNSYKYAFSKKNSGKLDIVINRFDKNSFKLIISDNGPGFPKNFNVKKAKSFGLRLVNRLVKQLHGELIFTNGNGANFEIIFKDSQARKTID